VDKAGGTRAKPPVVLTLADHQQSPDDVQSQIEEVQRRSGGSLRIQVTNRWLDQGFASDKERLPMPRPARSSWPRSTSAPTTPSA
jgi:hypothetical protein